MSRVYPMSLGDSERFGSVATLEGMAEGALLDLVCGPASPLPETYQRYRLVAHLGSGGQAEGYRAVRLCGGGAAGPVAGQGFPGGPEQPLGHRTASLGQGGAAPVGPQ